MKKQILSLLTGFVVSITAVSVIHCGCLFAQVPQKTSVAVEKAASSHCDHEKENKASESKECCGACSVEQAVFNHQTLLYKADSLQTPWASRFVGLNPSSLGLELADNLEQHALRFLPQNTSMHPRQPVYILFESLLF